MPAGKASPVLPRAAGAAGRPHYNSRRAPRARRHFGRCLATLTRREGGGGGVEAYAPQNPGNSGKSGKTAVPDVAAPSLAVLEPSLEQPGTGGGVPAQGKGWDWTRFKIPPKPFHNSIKETVEFVSPKNLLLLWFISHYKSPFNVIYFL